MLLKAKREPLFLVVEIEALTFHKLDLPFVMLLYFCKYDASISAGGLKMQTPMRSAIVVIIINTPVHRLVNFFGRCHLRTYF